MSSKLRYDAALPPFLAALRAQAATDAESGPDPQASARRRVGQKRSASEEAEDGPLVVDERGHAIDVKDGRIAGIDHDDDDDDTLAPPDRLVSSSSTAVAGGASSSNKSTAADTKKEKPAAIGSRRRRTGRVVGQDADSASEPAPPTPSKPKKKPTKKIKLSFDPDQG
ncbi:hypothetical protein CP532_6808 [Ophiocordyceps camponoti-leonardi (nom. inval.)]|nr:hypothetical protein CP532_6808 [Ophiocordyceps camponoti-leonardi (nom. inval.)]